MIALIDYGISNLRSVQKAFAHLGVEVTLVDTPDQLLKADRLFLPGVGAFPAGMDGLRARGLIEPIKQASALACSCCLNQVTKWATREDLACCRGM
jgi:glutamine amidotransferase